MASEDATGTSTIKYYTRAEVAKYNTATNSWIIIHDKVYDVTKFLKQHPGGEEVILEHAGRDGTEPFEDIGHSSDAREMMEPYKIGELVEEERTKSDDKKERDWANGASNGDSSSNREMQSIPGFNHLLHGHVMIGYCSGSWRSWLIPVVLGVLATLIYRYFISAH
ncbi:cytochrome b5-like isoform X2 [Vespa velutina]|uniref:cytochrome b5-like isoform X2 n=1 Tax=Vespa velutina TaxID=202808 RepID=UPI001FB255F1|nr:cytochrome b5-like isoform X2 [Vespa velutina]